MKSKKGQLGIIEGKYAIVGFFIGLIAAFVLILLGTKKVLPFKIPFVCGSVLFNKRLWKEKKAQLVMIEFQYFIGGFVVGLIAGLVLVWLGSAGILPFKIPFVC
ncbi:MAG: hypothetical protein KKH52_01510 [Nanoarchaeota archaeon]|nr:hypothetical protein [Nanoarchaeota archaeon]MBU1622749.1 hypothetical protein [Nanoarchaeota archaeon]MBU1974052.1 hypothetical protein [Nanoarchaeota archaeon]